RAGVVAVALQPGVGALLHRNRPGSLSAGRRLGGQLVQGARDRPHWRGVLHAGIAKDASHAASGVMAMSVWLEKIFSHRLRALVQKELNQIKRDRRIVMSLVLPPILQLMLFGSVMNPSVANVSLGVVDDSQSPQSRDLIAALGESGTFKLKGMYHSVDALGSDISVGQLDAGMVIPGDFARDLARGEGATVQVLLNAMNANTAAISQGYVQGVIRSF